VSERDPRQTPVYEQVLHGQGTNLYSFRGKERGPVGEHPLASKKTTAAAGHNVKRGRGGLTGRGSPVRLTNRHQYLFNLHKKSKKDITATSCPKGYHL